MRPSTSIAIVVPAREDLSYLSTPNTVLGAMHFDVLLVINARVPLLQIESLRHRVGERPMLVEEKEAEEAKEKSVRALKRRRR